MKTHYRHHLMTSASACGNQGSNYSPNPHKVTCRKCERSKSYKATRAAHTYTEAKER